VIRRHALFVTATVLAMATPCATQSVTNGTKLIGAGGVATTNGSQVAVAVRDLAARIEVSDSRRVDIVQRPRGVWRT